MVIAAVVTLARILVPVLYRMLNIFKLLLLQSALRLT